MSRSVDETYVSFNDSLSEGCIHVEHNLSPRWCSTAILEQGTEPQNAMSW